MKTITAILITAALAACATPAKDTVIDAHGVAWKHDTASATWTDPLGRTTNIDPRTPLCSYVSLSKNNRSCVVRR